MKASSIQTLSSSMKYSNLISPILSLYRSCSLPFIFLMSIPLRLLYGSSASSFKCAMILSFSPVRLMNFFNSGMNYDFKSHPMKCIRPFHSEVSSIYPESSLRGSILHSNSSISRLYHCTIRSCNRISFTIPLFPFLSGLWSS